MLTAADEHLLLRQYLARLLNTFASINEGITFNGYNLLFQFSNISSIV